MDKNLPDKWVRKAISDVLNNLNVDGEIIKCFDTRVTGSYTPDKYILMTTQTNSVDKANKCEWRWESSILLDFFTKYDRSGNTGSRLELDNILDEAREQLNTLSLDVLSGLTIVTQTQNYPNDITSVTDNEIVNRKFLRLELLIN
jgi:hypothetical protein